MRKLGGVGPDSNRCNRAASAWAAWVRSRETKPREPRFRGRERGFLGSNAPKKIGATGAAMTAARGCGGRADFGLRGHQRSERDATSALFLLREGTWGAFRRGQERVAARTGRVVSPLRGDTEDLACGQSPRCVYLRPFLYRRSAQRALRRERHRRIGQHGFIPSEDVAIQVTQRKTISRVKLLH